MPTAEAQKHHKEKTKTFRTFVFALRVCFGFLMFIGLFAFFSGIQCQSFGYLTPHFGSMICFPLSYPDDVVTDERGRIYVALRFYSRVQVYDQNGNFLFGFFTETGAGAFKLRIDSDGRLNVVTARSDKLHVYDRSGNLLSSKVMKEDFYSQIAHNHAKGFVDGAGNRYVIRAGIYRFDRHGNVTLRIRTPIILWPLIGPIPCLAFGAFFGFAGVYLRYWKANHRTVAGCEDLFPCGRIRRRDVLIRHDGSRCDCLLTSRGVCWARSVWKPYICVRYSDLRVTIKQRSLFNFKRKLHLQSKSSPILSICFSPKNFEKWVSQIETYTFDGFDK